MHLRIIFRMLRWKSGFDRKLTQAALACAACALAGCGAGSTATLPASLGATLQGKLHGGQQAVVGAHIYLMAAGTSGYGGASNSLLNAAKTGASDSTGAYVLTDANGNFSVSGDYVCTPGTQVYLYALGGNPGSGTNAAAGFLAVLGNCPAAGNFAAATPFLWVNEVSTIAAAYALAGFATDATHVSSSGSALARAGLANASLNAANLANLATGVALGTTPAGNGTVPQTEINTLANILASCVNTTGAGSTACATLFANTQSAGSSGTLPSDTATAAINLAHNSGNATTTLFGLQTGLASPFAPALSVHPNDFSIALSFTGGGMVLPLSVAIDGAGNAWTANQYNPTGTVSSVSEFSSTGAAISPAAGYADNLYPTSVSIDTAGNAWLTNSYNSSVSKITSAGVTTTSAAFLDGLDDVGSSVAAFDSAGNLWIPDGLDNNVVEISSSMTGVSPAAGYTGGGLNIPRSLALDAFGYVWVTNGNGANLTKLSATGAVVSGSAGFTGGGLSGPTSIAIDHAGNAWVANSNNSVSAFTSSGLALSPAGGYTGSNLNHGAEAVAIDGLGNVWLAARASPITELSSSGAQLGATYGFYAQTGGGDGNIRASLAIDSSGNIWTNDFMTTSNNNLTEFIGLAAPVVTPLVVAVKTNTLGTRP